MRAREGRKGKKGHGKGNGVQGSGRGANRQKDVFRTKNRSLTENDIRQAPRLQSSHILACFTHQKLISKTS